MIKPEEVPVDIVRAAQQYDVSHRPPMTNWGRVTDQQLRRLLAGALNELERERERDAE